MSNLSVLNRTYEGARRFVPRMVASALLLGAAAVAYCAERGPSELEFEATEGTWISLDVAPSGRTLVFELLGDLYELPIKGGAAKPLLTGTSFDSQPAYSPDGTHIAFVSDRSGNENLWIARRDGSDPRPLSRVGDNTEFTSPAWSADGKTVFVSRITVARNVFDLWSYAVDGSGGEQLTQGVPQPGMHKRARRSALGAHASPDGRYIYYASRFGDFLEQSAYEQLPFPLWNVVRRDLASGAEETVVSSPGGAFRPRLSPNGKQVVYGSRRDGLTGLRLRDLETGTDRWLRLPAQTDQQEGWPSRDVLPGYAFTPDGKSLVLSRDGHLERIEISSGAVHIIPFNSRVSLKIGASAQRDLVEDEGPVRSRLIQSPAVSPDGSYVAFSAFAQIYVMKLGANARPRRLTTGSAAEFQPSWSTDGRSILFVTWNASEGGHLWKVPVTGGAPRRLTETPAFYSHPVMTPDGREILALRSSHDQHLRTRIALGPFRQAEVVRLPATGGAARIITSGMLTGPPQLAGRPQRLYLYRADGLISMQPDGTDERVALKVAGPAPHFHEGPFRVDDVRISPDGLFALVQAASQMHLVSLAAAGEAPLAINPTIPSPAHRQLTAIGADFIGWADQGRSIAWSVGSTLYRANADGSCATGNIQWPGGCERTARRDELAVELPRDMPAARTLVLRGATAITMRGDEVIEDADIVIRANRIVSVAPRGSVPIPRDAFIREIPGKTVVPGFVDSHAHWLEIRRGILDLESWVFAANLAYGITAGLDTSPLTIDALAYWDLLDAGRMTGMRAYTTGPAVLSWNHFMSREQVRDVLSRYRDYYRVRNLKGYWSGNRRQRQWVAATAAELGLVTTTEGALNEKLMLTQVIDGFPGSEHALTTVPLSQDVIHLFAATRVSYTPTLLIGNGGPHAKSHLIDQDALHQDPKLRRFVPHMVVDDLSQRRPSYHSQEYRYPRVAQGAAAIQRAGGVLAVGSHGELQGRAFHWEMQALAAGGLTPMEILRAATLGSSEAIGRARDLGSLESGKLADLLILDADPRTDITHTLSLREVMKNGRLYEADTLDQIWPERRIRPTAWFAPE